jgi:heat-inducible transcriptional repressor
MGASASIALGRLFDVADKPSNDDLGARQGEILNAVVREFIASGEPVASRSIVGRYRLAVSSATVRNDMSRLEELGFLTQPHTSAGRIPTDRGYRFFVDGVPQPGPLETRHERALESALARSSSDLEELLHRASEVLSAFTRQAAAVLAPQVTESKLRHLDLVLLAPRIALVVVITGAGRVEKRIVEFDADVSQDELDAVQRALAETLEGKRLADGPSAVANAKLSEPRATTARRIAAALDEIANDERRLFVDGTSNLAAEPSLMQSDALQHIIEALERQTSVLNVLSSGVGDETRVHIGSEMNEETLQACSVVMSSYALGGMPLGVVGVIGPTRMDYALAMAVTRAVANVIEDRLRQISG